MSKLVFNLPMLTSHTLKPSIRPVSSKKVRLFLGSTFYGRVANIYRNLVTAIAKDDWTYLAAALEPELYKSLTKEISQIKSNNFKIKMIQGKGKSIGVGKRRKKLNFRENEWVDEFSKVSVECKVIFG